MFLLVESYGHSERNRSLPLFPPELRWYCQDAPAQVVEGRFHDKKMAFRRAILLPFAAFLSGLVLDDMWLQDLLLYEHNGRQDVQKIGECRGEGTGGALCSA